MEKGKLVKFSFLLSVPAVIGAAILARLLVARLKETLTYPRTGYLSYTRPRPSRRFLSAGIAIGVAILVTIASSFLSAAQTEQLIPAVTGLLDWDAGWTGSFLPAGRVAVRIWPARQPLEFARPLRFSLVLRRAGNWTAHQWRNHPARLPAQQPTSTSQQ